MNFPILPKVCENENEAKYNTNEIVREKYKS